MTLDIHTRFQQLSALLQETQQYWRPKAFHDHHLPVMDLHPELVYQLYALSEDEVVALANDDDALTQTLADALPFVTELAALTALPALPQRSLPGVSPHFHTGVPGRKWQQVQNFARCLPGDKLPILEWCAGKSHLGFYLQHCFNQEVTALEWDKRLAAEANARAARDGRPLHSHEVDVLADNAKVFLKKSQQAVALHACGDLHERLLHLCTEIGVEQIHLAPCCYHKRRLDTYIPLSESGRSQDLKLDKSDLHTAIMETATAGATVRRQRIRMQTMRLGFDCLQRDLRSTNQFLPLPSLPSKWARASFKEFCRHCSRLKAIELPRKVDWEYYWRLGEQRFQQVAALDLVRMVFRRPLEVWLVLDQAIFLQERGYSTEIGTFCCVDKTPRNLLLQAHYQ